MSKLEAGQVFSGVLRMTLPLQLTKEGEQLYRYFFYVAGENVQTEESLDLAYEGHEAMLLSGARKGDRVAMAVLDKGAGKSKSPQTIVDVHERAVQESEHAVVNRIIEKVSEGVFERLKALLMESGGASGATTPSESPEADSEPLATQEWAAKIDKGFKAADIGAVEKVVLLRTISGQPDITTARELHAPNAARVIKELSALVKGEKELHDIYEQYKDAGISQ